MKPNRNPVILAALLSISLRGQTSIGNPPPDPPRSISEQERSAATPSPFASAPIRHQPSVRSCISMARLGVLRTQHVLGTQWSRLDGRTAEIVRECAGGRCVRLIRRAESSGVLVLEITEENSEGRRSERRLVLERR